MTVYHITLGDERTTEELVAAAKYGYCHSQVFSDNFPARPFNGETPREIVLLTFDHPVSSEEATAEAAKQGLERPYYETPSISGSSTRRCSWRGRWPSSMTHGWATTDAATQSASGTMKDAVSWVWRVLTISGSQTTVWPSLVRRECRPRK